VQVVLSFVACLALLEATIVASLRHSWGYMFSSDPEIIEIVAQVLPLIAVYICGDALGPGTLSSILRAAGTQHARFDSLLLCRWVLHTVRCCRCGIIGMVFAPAFINFFAFYAVGIPLGLCELCAPVTLAVTHHKHP